MKARAPAAVHYRLVPGKVPRVFVVLLGGAGLLHLLAWLGAQHTARYCSTWFWLPVILAHAVVWVLLWGWQKRLPAGWLVWTGAVWRLQPASAGAWANPQGAGAAYQACDMVVDAKNAVLLRLHAPESSGAAASQWVWVTRASARTQWHALRCVLVWAQSGKARAGLAPAPGGLQ